jgi:hypothetical protein
MRDNKLIDAVLAWHREAQSHSRYAPDRLVEKWSNEVGICAPEDRPQPLRHPILGYVSWTPLNTTPCNEASHRTLSSFEFFLEKELRGGGLLASESKLLLARQRRSQMKALRRAPYISVRAYLAIRSLDLVPVVPETHRRYWRFQPAPSGTARAPRAAPEFSHLCCVCSPPRRVFIHLRLGFEIGPCWHDSLPTRSFQR